MFLKDITLLKVIEQLVLFAFISLFIWGGNNKFGRKNEINEDFTSLETMKSLRGFAAIGVILHHISQEEVFQSKGVLTPFVNAGAYFVAIFFFCSGYGLLKSLDSKPDYLKGFIRNRIVKAIVVPFYINVILYGILMLITGASFKPAHVVCNLLGITMMNEYAWFPIVLALLYLVFYLCFRFIKNRPVCFTIILLFIFGLGVLFCYNGHFVWWKGKNNWWLFGNTGIKWWQKEKVFWFSGEWWVNSAPAFFTGLLFAQFEKKITAFFRKLYCIKFFVLLAVTQIAFKLSSFGQSKFGYWTEYSGNGPGIADKFKTYLCQFPLFLLLGLTVVVFLMKYHASNPVTRFFGKYSLHTYLMNLAALVAMRFILYNDAFTKMGNVKLYLFGAGVFAVSVILGMGEQHLTGLVQKLLFKNKAKKTAG